MPSTSKKVAPTPFAKTERNDFIESERKRLAEDFILQTIACYRAIRQSLLHLFYGKRTEKVFSTIQSIVEFRGIRDEDELVSNIAERLLEKLTRDASEGSFLFTKLQDTLTNSFETLLKDHLRGIQKLEGKIQKLGKGEYLNGQTLLNGSQVMQKVEDFSIEKEILRLGKIERRLVKETIHMVRLAQKMAEKTDLNKQDKLKVLKTAKLTLSLITEMELGMTEKYSASESNQTNVSKNSLESSLNTFKRQSFFGTKVAKNSVSTEPGPPSCDDNRHINYNIFTALSLKPKDSPVSAWLINEDTDGKKTAVPNTQSNIQDIHEISMEIDIDEDDASGDVINNLAKAQDVYVTVVREYMTDKKGHLNLKPGMKIKQKLAADTEDLAYGWTRKSRFAKKKYGLYPISHVVLQN